MAITITWPATNAGTATAIRIYASTTRIADEALGTPIATLAGTETSYLWTPPTDNTVYYFRIAIDVPTDTFLGDNQVYGYFSTTGPGPQTLARGSWELGYFGRVTTAEMLTTSALQTAVGAAGIPGVVANPGISHYCKFIREGKILFMPVGGMVTNTYWESIYALGLVYGTDDNGAYPAGLTIGTPKNQKKIITIAGFNFLVRLPKGSTLPTTTLVTADPADKIGSEWDQTMGRFNGTALLPDNQSSWDDTTNIASTSTQSSNYTQHMFTLAKACLHRGSGANIDSIISLASASTGANYSWAPVLELQF